ncbi:MAG: UDP-N-acetylmuramoyl-L-alanine--D-glutamate ligase [Wenzhouxiangellaceae bacterium]|nr:UDP-N-acetylmuramoyl-L-alanine--D-glutamate ligase [Wenzhouxiangellaceae bacterium]
MRPEALSGRRVSLLGFGREGRALEAALAALSIDADVHVWSESRPDREPAAWPLTVGPLDARIAEADLVLRSPGVPDRHSALQACRRAGVPVTGPSSLWFGARPDQPCIAVTGSKGKSTTTMLVAELLRAAGNSVEVAGNIGRPLVGLLDADADWFVVELSSYQLVDLQGRPSVGVITRLFPEHADWHGSEQAYYDAKLRLVDLLEGRPLWINGGDARLADAVRGVEGLNLANLPDDLHGRNDGLWRGEKRLLSAEDWPLAGRHNLDNLALAWSVVESVTDEAGAARFVAAARAFRALPHRLEEVPGPSGRRYVNDSIATTPYATRAALETCRGPVVLIAGGQPRDADWTPVVEVAGRHRLRGLVTLPDNGPAVARFLVDRGAVGGERVRAAGGIEEAVELADAMAGPGATILLSPGAPSFPHFRDFEERGRRFRDAVGRLASGPESRAD